jgi:hypothetical protein
LEAANSFIPNSNSNIPGLNVASWHPKNVQNFFKNYSQFNEMIVLPMVKKCANNRFGVDLKDKFSRLTEFCTPNRISVIKQKALFHNTR